MSEAITVAGGGGGNTIDPALFDGLAGRLRGSLERPGSPAYEEGRTVWNAMIDCRPAAVARARGVADVLTCVGFAREHGVALSIKGGGHNIAGLAVCDGGLVLDMSLQRGVWVDAAGRVARAEAGCLLADVDAETQVHGLATALGFVSLTGAAGLTLGGGFGYLTRRFGWTSDNVLAMDVVTADGRVVRASEEENPDLFWALCGGGGNFGVVTGFDYRLHPIGPQIYGGAIAWRAEDAGAVLAMYQELVASAPLELTCTLVLRRAPPAPWIDRAAHGQPVVVLVVCDTGPIDEAEARLAAVKRFGAPVGDVVQRRPYTTQQALLDATQPKGRRYYWKSEYLQRLEPEALAGALGHLARMPSPHSAIIFFPIGGALNGLPEDHRAAGHRSAEWVLNITGSWERADDDGPNVQWARSTWEDLRRFSTGGTYVNFLTADEGAERTRAAYGESFDRLREVKRRWDPENLFRVNKNIAP